MNKLLITVFLATLAIAVFQACKDDSKGMDPDKALFSELSSAGYTYYQGGALLNPTAPSPHGTFKLRFNSIASAALDGTGELPAGNVFPNGSIIVKEVYTGSTLSLYAITKKEPANPNAGSGWLWAELKPDGAAAYSVTLKGSGCVSCHSTLPNRDLAKTFDLH